MKDKDIMISVIVPVYNAQEYIEKCLNSIIDQNYKNLDIIVVDDGSTDNTANICKKICEQDSRVRLIMKLNGGVSSARNVGLDNAKAENIVFVDSDDWLNDDYCEKLVQYAGDYDLVCCGYNKVTAFGVEKHNIDEENIFTDDISDFFGISYGKGLFSAPWNKMYKKSIIDKQRFDESAYLGEDHFFNLVYLEKCLKIAIIKNNLYNYNCVNSDSATRKSFCNDVKSIVSIYDMTTSFIQTYCNGKYLNIARKDFVLSGIGVVQRIFYSDTEFKVKKRYLKELFTSEAFKECFYKKYNIVLQYRFIQCMCKYKLYFLLYLFFYIKKIIYLKYYTKL